MLKIINIKPDLELTPGNQITRSNPEKDRKMGISQAYINVAYGHKYDVKPTFDPDLNLQFTLTIPGNDSPQYEHFTNKDELIRFANDHYAKKIENHIATLADIINE